eukprot:6192165-Pleurochrysis_carterae.AAC.1
MCKSLTFTACAQNLTKLPVYLPPSRHASRCENQSSEHMAPAAVKKRKADADETEEEEVVDGNEEEEEEWSDEDELEDDEDDVDEQAWESSGDEGGDDEGRPRRSVRSRLPRSSQYRIDAARERSWVQEQADEVRSALSALEGTGSITSQPSALRNCKMHNYQLDGLRWAAGLLQHGTGGGILADEMGLGKTLQAIALMAHLDAATSAGCRHLVVAPLSTISGWTGVCAGVPFSPLYDCVPSPPMRYARFHKAARACLRTVACPRLRPYVRAHHLCTVVANQLSRFYPSLTVLRHTGTAASRAEARAGLARLGLGQSCALLASYESVLADGDSLRKCGGWSCAVIDEYVLFSTVLSFASRPCTMHAERMLNEAFQRAALKAIGGAGCE